ncbi:hypothetical protein [Streptomyces sp. NPDC059816]|uniref:hypothetical protein n=1 Tax=Streptomyces sp. NPDC059816 TaxID=3346960 RepID=UPI003654E4A0
MIGEAVADSEAVHAALTTVVEVLDPGMAVAERAHEALLAVTGLVELRPEWIAYCDETFALDSVAADPASEMSRLWVSGDLVRAWPRFTVGKAALVAATGPLHHVRRELAAFCGTEPVRRRAAA